MTLFLDVGGKDWEDLATDTSLLHMGHNCNHLPLDPRIKEALMAAMEAEEYRNYPPPYGFERLRTLIGEGLDLPEAEVLITHGSTDAIYQGLSVILRPGDEIITTDPGWPHIPNFALGLGASVVEIPIYSPNTQYKLVPELVEERINERTRLIAIIDPLNPLGSSYTEEEIKTLCGLAEKHGLYVLHDSTYRDFADEHYPAVRYYERAFMSVSLSKACGFSGFRIGAVVSRKPLFDEMLEKHVSRLGVNWIAQRGAIAAYESKAEWLPELLKANRQHHTQIHECLQDVEGMNFVVHPSMGNFVAVDVAGMGCSAEDIVKEVLEAGIIIRAGGYASPRFGNKFLRITTTVPTEHVTRLCEVLPEISEKRGH